MGIIIQFMTEKELTEKLIEIRALPAETEIVEFKEAKTSFLFDNLGKYFSALSNEANLRSADSALLKKL